MLDYRLGHFEIKDLERKAEEYSQREKVYETRKSHASVKLSEITGFMYGGFSARFWMMRKHII